MNYILDPQTLLSPFFIESNVAYINISGEDWTCDEHMNFKALTPWMQKNLYAALQSDVEKIVFHFTELDDERWASTSDYFVCNRSFIYDGQQFSFAGVVRAMS